MKTTIYKFVTGIKPYLFLFLCIAFSSALHAQTTFTFAYTGSVQTISLQPGSYSVQCWGADGGNAVAGTTTLTGGKGGYAAGVFSVATAATFNVYVGGRGGNASGANVGSGGGGMSDIAPALNSTLIVIAAGGGGGSTAGSTASENSSGGNGGGLIGATANDGTGVSGGTAATGGSQSTGGSATAGSYGAGSPGGYGYGGGAANGGTAGVIHSPGGGGGSGGNGGWNGGGGGCTLTGINDHAAGGGAGYYGGGGGRGDGGAGGGGSSYIGAVSSGTTIMFGQPGFIGNPDPTGNGRVLITELCSISLNATGNNSLNPSICSGQSLTLTTNATSNYSWSTGATTSSLVVAPTTNTVYALAATSPANCNATANISVTVSSGVPSLTISASNTQVCPGQSVTLNASGANSYSWTNGVTNGLSFAPATTSLYVVSAQNGCGSSTANITISVSPLPVLVASSHATLCANRTATLTATAIANSYTWQPINSIGTSSTIIVSPLANTIYTVTASDGTCTGNSTVSLGSSPVPTISAAATATSICPGDAITLTAAGGLNYTWTPGGTVASSIVVTPSATSLYSVSGDNSFGCENGASQVIIVGVQPTLSISSDFNPICAGASAVFSVSGADNYAWGAGPNTSTFQVNPSQTSTYFVTGTLTASGCTSTANIILDVFNPVMSVTGNSLICPGQSTSFTASAFGATSYTWNPNGTLFNPVTLTPSVTSIYTVSTTSYSNSLGCPVSQTVQVVVNPTPTVSALSTPSVMCKNETATLNASGAVSYVWSSTSGTIAASASVAITSTNITVLNYTVTGLNAFGCADSKALQIIVNACTGIESYGSASKVLVYPNPNNGEFTIQAGEAADVKLVNSLGQLLRVLPLRADTGYKLNVSDLPQGVYFVIGQNINLKVVVDK